jgi:hypothetical protein
LQQPLFFTDWRFVLGQPMNGPDRNMVVNKLVSRFRHAAEAARHEKKLPAHPPI